MNKLNVVLLLLALASGMAVITVQDQSREYFIALTNAQKQQTQLNETESFIFGEKETKVLIFTKPTKL